MDRQLISKLKGALRLPSLQPWDNFKLSISRKKVKQPPEVIFEFAFLGTTLQTNTTWRWMKSLPELRKLVWHFKDNGSRIPLLYKTVYRLLYMCIWWNTCIQYQRQDTDTNMSKVGLVVDWFMSGIRRMFSKENHIKKEASTVWLKINWRNSVSQMILKDWKKLPKKRASVKQTAVEESRVSF